MSQYKEYLGDGVYLDFDGFHIVLTAEDGVSAAITIYLEPEFPERIVKYRDRIYERIKNERDSKKINE